MSESKEVKKPTGKAVRDVKAEDKATEKDPALNQGTQIHAGNIPVVTVKLLDEINKSLTRIAIALEKANG